MMSNPMRFFLENREARKAIILLYLIAYLAMGIYTELKLAELFPVPTNLLQDQVYYDRALTAALDGRDPYLNRNIGTGYLYPPQALLIVELFSHLRTFFFRVTVFTMTNIMMLALIVNNVAKHYGLALQQVWYWYILCFAFAPFLEVLHAGQINVIAMFGIFLMFYWEATSPALSGFGLSLAALSKVTPAIFVLYLAINRRYKVIAYSALAGLLIIGLSIWRYGVGPTLTYPGVFVGLLQDFIISHNSQSLASKLAVANDPEFQSFVSVLPGSAAAALTATAGWFSIHFRLVQRIYSSSLLLLIALSAYLTRRGEQPREPLFIVSALAVMLAPNILWYHHYVFMLLPLLVWMGRRGLEPSVVTWACIGMLIVQIDRRFPPYGLLIHAFNVATILNILYWQLQQLHFKNANNPPADKVQAQSSRA